MTIASIIIAAVPLMLCSFGALISDYSGRLAIFMEGIINLSAFLCFAFTVKCHALPCCFQAAAGCIIAVIACASIASLFLFMTEKTKADPFLMGLSLNIICNALVSLLSSIMFSSRGVLTAPSFVFNASKTLFLTTLPPLLLLSLSAIALMLTKQGLYIRLCGKDAKTLDDSGISSKHYARASWIIAACFGAISGCILSFRLSSFVPGAASGRGWLSCAAVYMARSISAPMAWTLYKTKKLFNAPRAVIHKRKNCKLKGNSKNCSRGKDKKENIPPYLENSGLASLVFLVSIAMSFASLFASRVQNFLPDVMPAATLSMPYIACLLLLALFGKKV